MKTEDQGTVNTNNTHTVDGWFSLFPPNDFYSQLWSTATLSEQTKGCWREEEAAHHTFSLPVSIILRSVREHLSPTILSLQFVSLTAGETVTSSIGPETGGGHIATDINKRLHLFTTTAPFS